ncbi:bifunctional tRNA (5-methylaminomethyl-2-thiouridine)(34)-methyltransferase MnmD/FAD-dependent 5-carboxymethylaminomethyl-2-thiouridine(34) oxidoreductase MnmC, partial [Pseudomonas sp.]
MQPAPDAPNQQAHLEWDEQGQPLSSQFADVYFSNENALAETRYVFLANNLLPERFAVLTADQQLVIGETGFGTGLNFLCAWQLFEQHAVASARLHFVSVEKYPLNKADLQRALALWPELAPYAEPLLTQYVALHPGFQRLVFAGGRVVLTLLIGDALELFGQLDGQIDAWFLDGFAPAKNPDMWTPELFAELARLSHASTTLGTFTSTGYVRRRLNDAGFKMKRVPGLGKKWEVLKGTFIGTQVTAEKPWFTRPPQPVGERSALVIGAGLSGCATAASLAARGWQVTLLERHGAIAQEASGNPQGVLYLKLSAHHTSLSRLIVSGYGHSRRLLEQLQKGTDWDNCGVLQLAFDAKEAQRQTQLAAAFPTDLLTNLDRSAAEAKAGIPLPAGGLFYPEAGWVHPPALCALFSQQPNIQLQLHQEALELRRDGDSWQAWNGEQLLASARVVVLASAAEIKG